MNKVVVSRAMVNICTMQVCAEADATDEEILEVCNKGNPAGTQGGWSLVLRQDKCDGALFREANKAPIPCELYPGRIHFLVCC